METWSENLCLSTVSCLFFFRCTSERMGKTLQLNAALNFVVFDRKTQMDPQALSALSFTDISWNTWGKKGTRDIEWKIGRYVVGRRQFFPVLPPRPSLQQAMHTALRDGRRKIMIASIHTYILSFSKKLYTEASDFKHQRATNFVDRREDLSSHDCTPCSPRNAGFAGLPPK